MLPYLALSVGAEDPGFCALTATNGAISKLLGVCEPLTLALGDMQCPLGSLKK